MEKNDIQKLQDEFEACCDRVKRLYKIAKEQNCEEARVILQKVWLRLRQGPVRALVMGVSSAGKSTLINALAGQIIVPEAKRTSSPIPVWVCSRNAPDMPQVEIMEKGRDYIQDPIFCKHKKYLTDYCYTSREAGSGTGQEKFENVIAARVNVKSDAISDAGITLIDMPGIGVSKMDDELVEKILDLGCELLIVVFMENSIQEAGLKDYFRDLLVADNAPLHALLENNRVFMVCNTVKSAVLTTLQNARMHIKDAFEGWTAEDRLFAVNARDARIRACGVYDYVELLGYYTEKEEEQTEAAKADELKRAEEILQKDQTGAQSRQQEELEELCQSVGQAAEELCADPEELLAPVRKDLNRAQALLEKLIRERQAQVKAADFPVSPELKEMLDRLEKALSRLQQQSQKLEQLDTGRAFSEKEWPLDAPREPKTVNASYLLADDPNKAEAVLLQGIESENWHHQITLLVCSRMGKLRSEQLAAMEKPDENPESKHWRDFFDSFRGILASVDPGGRRLLPPEETERFFAEAADLFSEAEAAGKKAMLNSPAYVLSPAKKDQLVEYLAKKRKKVLAGGIWGRLARAWLDIDVKSDQLRPLVRSAAAEGRKAFLTAYHDTLWGDMNILRQELDNLLAKMRGSLRRQYRSVKHQIKKERAAAKKEQLDKLEKTLDAIREITGSAERTENNG